MARPRGLGGLEQQVLEYLWAHGPSTGEAVRAAVSKDRPLTDSTIRTVLRRLEAKHYVKHDLDGRQFLYAAARGPLKVATEAVRNVIKTFCRGSVEELLTGLVDHRVVDSAELKRLAAKIEEQEKRAPTAAASRRALVDQPSPRLRRSAIALATAEARSAKAERKS